MSWELTNSIRSVVLDPEDTAQRGMAGHQWIKDYHSARRTVALQANVYRSLIEEKLRGRTFLAGEKPVL